MKRIPSWIGWVVALAAVGILTLVFFPQVGPAGAPPPQPALGTEVQAPPLAVVSTPAGPFAITPFMALVGLVLVVVGGAIVTGVVLSFVVYRLNRFVVEASQPAALARPERRRVRRTSAGHVAAVGYKTYLGVFVVLVVLTALEVGVASLPGALHQIAIPFLVVFAIVKAGLVAMFYMHLKYDSPIYSFVFATPLVLVVILAFFVLQLQ